MNLVVFGDSWAVGQELSPGERPFGYWLSKHLNATSYLNFGITGSSNDRTVVELDKFIQGGQTEDCIAVFFITDQSRYLHIDDNNNYKDFGVPKNWKDEKDPHLHNYFKYFYSYKQSYIKFCKNILCMQRMCEQNNIDDYYIVGWGTADIKFSGINQNKIYPKTCVELFGAEVLSDTEFYPTKDNKYVTPNAYHPNQLGHQYIAETLYHWIKNDNSKI